MMLLTRRKELERRQKQQELRRISNDAIKIYNTSNAMRCNPFAGDTTALPFGRDNAHVHLQLTENDILDSVLYPNKHKHAKKNFDRLVPEVVSDEIKDQWLQKIRGSALRSAKALKENC